MRKLFLVSLLFLILSVPVMSAPAGEVHLIDNPGSNDYVKYYLEPPVNASALEKEISRGELEPELRTAKTEGGVKQLKYSVSMGERTGLLSRSVDLERLAPLNISRAENFTVSYDSSAAVRGPVERTGGDFLQDRYRVKKLSGSLEYRVPGSTAGLSAVSLLALLVLPFTAFRYYARRVEKMELEKEEKVHRLNRAAIFGISPLMVLLLPVVFESGMVLVSRMVFSSVLPVSGINLALVGIMGAILVPVLGAGGSAFLGIYPSLKRIRDLDTSRKGGVKKFLAGMGLVLVPVAGWQFLVVNLPAGFASSLPVLLVAFGAFILGVMALSPYLMMVFQSSRSTEGEIREELEEFCGAQGLELRDIRTIEARGMKNANAVVAGTVPGFNYVFITDYLLDNFSRDEIEAVLAHELGHLERHHLWIKGGAGFVFFGAWMALVTRTSLVSPVMDVAGFYGFMGLIMAVLAFYFLGVQGFISQKLEYEADRHAAEIKGEEVTRSALEKLADANDMKRSAGRLYSLARLHPSIEDRLEKLG
ncbi:MAG: M48 family metalloprotease [Candidatus Nanohaloarchaea archaeon]